MATFVVAGGLAFAGDRLGPTIFSGLKQISDSTASLYTTATLVPAPRRDPLVLDLDGDTLKASVYQALLLQTRLKLLLDEVQLNITATGVALDFTALDADLSARLNADVTHGFEDFADFTSAANDGWWRKAA